MTGMNRPAELPNAPRPPPTSCNLSNWREASDARVRPGADRPWIRRATLMRRSRCHARSSSTSSRGGLVSGRWSRCRIRSAGGQAVSRAGLRDVQLFHDSGEGPPATAAWAPGGTQEQLLTSRARFAQSPHLRPSGTSPRHALPALGRVVASHPASRELDRDEWSLPVHLMHSR